MKTRRSARPANRSRPAMGWLRAQPPVAVETISEETTETSPGTFRIATVVGEGVRTGKVSQGSQTSKRRRMTPISGQSNSINEKSRHSKGLQILQEVNLPFRSVRKLGYGAFGIVDEIVHSPSNTRFARKRFHANLKAPSQASGTGSQRNYLSSPTQPRAYNQSDGLTYNAGPNFYYHVSHCRLQPWGVHAQSRSTGCHQEIILLKWFGCLASALSYVHRMSWLHMGTETAKHPHLRRSGVFVRLRQRVLNS